MAVIVGINGFGRIGRVAFRTCLQNPDIQVAAINDPAIDTEYICYLIKFDSTHGRFNGTVTQTEEGIKVDGKLIRVFHEKLPSNVPWHTVGVQYVVEASGMFTCLEKAAGHLASNTVRRVIVTAPSIDVPMIILGVNDNKLGVEQKVLSCASSTLYCLAPIIKVLEDKFGVAEGFITSIHAMTPSLKPLDGLCLRGKHWRDHRSIHQNIIPATTGACKALGKIIPRVKDKLTGLAFRVPIVDVSVLDLTIRLNTNTTLEDIIKTVESVSKSGMENILKISSDQAVSSDFLTDSHSCILDADSSLQLKPNFFKIICWYENEYSYARRIVDSIFFSEKQFYQRIQLLSSITFVRPRIQKKYEYDRKEMTMKCSCNSEINTKMICSTSQDTGFRSKQLSRPIILRKPISSHTSHTVSSLSNRDTKKKNEVFKVRNENNDVKKQPTRQNRNTFFQSCFPAKQNQNEVNTDCNKAQERLDNVKKEFNKMVNITEDLLKKSSNKFKFSSLATTSKEDVYSANNVLGASSIQETKTVCDYINKAKLHSSINDVCGDCKNDFDVTNVVVKKYSRQEVTLIDKAVEKNENVMGSAQLKTGKHVIRGNKDTSNVKTNKNANSRNFFGETAVMAYHPECTDEITETSNCNFDFKEQVAKTITTLIAGLSQKMQGKTIDNNECAATYDVNDNIQNEALVVKELMTSIIETNDKSKTEIKKCDTHVLEIKKTHNINTDTTDETPERDKLRDVVKYLHSENYNMRIIDEELKKRNIILVNSQTHDTNYEVYRSTGNERLTVKKNDLHKDVALKKRIIDSLNRCVPEPVIIIPEDTSGCNSPENTSTTINDSKKYKQDIYDKLDSASATDSDDSFDINQRKSQVIHITDLTNSLEDLVRLDKICRIIEISDELSDKLFSTLDNCDTAQVQKKKWSFKDLCERIKLDDFCNQVFGNIIC